MTTKKNYYCSNYNKLNHDYKDCKEPITSWGIILINLTSINKNLDKLVTHSNNINIKNKVFNIFPQNYKDLEHMTDKELERHYLIHGVNEKRICNSNISKNI